MDKIKALTVWEPWATLIVIGAKGYETRPWPTNHRGPIAIHAAKYHRLNHEVYTSIAEALGIKYDGSFLAELENDNAATSTFGCIIGTVNIIDCIRTDGSAAELVDKTEKSLGDWRPGRWAWLLDNPKIFPSPVPCRGRQGLWWCEVPSL